MNKEDEVFGEDELPLVIEYLKEHVDIWNMGLLLMFQTGMRVGEVTALTQGDIYPDYIRVCKTEVNYKNDEGTDVFHIQETAKSDAGNRKVMLVDGAKWTLERILELNPDGEFLLMNQGKRVLGNTLNKRLVWICEKLGLPLRSTHKIRKTYGTTLLDSGEVNESVVASQMGHSDIATTRKHYYYDNKNMDTKIQQINKAIGF